MKVGVMNRSHIINKIAKDTGVSRVLADQMIDSFVAVVINSLKQEVKVNIRDFGSWEISQCQPRKGVNPKTGEPLAIKAKKRPRFIAGKRFKRVLNRESL